MEKSLFYNALPDENEITGYDRNYNADDLSDWLATVLTTGVIKSDTALKVSPASGMIIEVAAGRAVINGKPYVNDASKIFTVPTAPTGATPRVDLVVLRFDKSQAVRKTSLVYITGTGNSIPAIRRNAVYYDLALAKITVQPNATAINAGDITDLRGDKESSVTTASGTALGYCPWLVAAKGYEDYYDAIVLRYEDSIIMPSAGTVVTFNIPTYGWTGADLLSVYTNGIREKEENYTVTNKNTITFKSSKVANTEVLVVVEKTIDGEGLGTALDQYLELQAMVLGMQKSNEYAYICNGVNDNVKLSELVNAFLTGSSSLYEDMTIKIYGQFGATAPIKGLGTSASPYVWIDAGLGSATTRRVYLDFGNCSQIALPQGEDDKYYIVFFGLHTYIKNCNIIANGSNSHIYMFSSAAAVVNYCENCRFWITAASGYISRGGTFKNCRCSLTITANDAYIFNVLSGGLLRVFGGEFICYAPTGQHSSVVYVNSAQTNAVAITYGMNCPTISRGGYVQSFAINCNTNSALCSFTDTITTLPITAAGQNTRGIIAISKAGLY